MAPIYRRHEDGRLEAPAKQRQHTAFCSGVAR